MRPCNNLPPEQHRVQRLVDQFNADERRWESLESRRQARRKSKPKLSARKLKALALREFAKAKPPQECVGEPLAP